MQTAVVPFHAKLKNPNSCLSYFMAAIVFAGSVAAAAAATAVQNVAGGVADLLNRCESDSYR